MHASIALPRGLSRLTIALVLVLTTLATGASVQRTLAQDETATPTITPAEGLCESRDDLRLIVTFLQTVDIEDDGLIPVAVGVIAGISETRQLLDFTGDTYRPLIEDLLISFQGLSITIDELSEQETLGARIATVATSIADVGNAMDALGSQLREPCPE